WSTDNARNNMKQVLADNYSDGKTLDAVICANDSTALGVTEAVQSNYSGSNHPLIVGQDGDVENLKNIVDGSQDMTVFKNVNDEAKVTLEICKLILSNETPNVSLLENLHVDVKYDTSSYNNGVKYIQSYLLAPYAVDKDNLQSLVDTGIYKWDSSNKYLEIAK
ncbi:MAG: substrate-binding domain-containing protein, partial [Ruminococcus sp.]|nr:substrate-binding domain-containing protein [Ruminococcus sp.]